MRDSYKDARFQLQKNIATVKSELSLQYDLKKLASTI